MGFAVLGRQFVEITLGVNFVNQKLLMLQLLSYTPIVAFGFLLVLRYQEISIPKLLTLVSVTILAVIYLFIAKLTITQFLMSYMILGLVVFLITLIRSGPVSAMEENK